MADGRRNLARVKAFNRLIDKTLGRRIGSFDAAAAQETAILMRSRQHRASRGLSGQMTAGIVLAGRAALATHNVKHFDDAGIEAINPSHG